MHAFIFSRLDYCKASLQSCLKKKKEVRQLQLIQNAAARIQIKIGKQSTSLHPQIPALAASSRPLRSSGSGLLSIPRVRTKHDEAAFSFSAPKLWNKLPENLRSALTVAAFKTSLFSSAFN
ncbi:hypothetical protein LDENG_00182350 [Lucifuga dentata]|nr:hypothetical protein LDENG_00182350 [Lucifuga dentata]